MNGTYIAMALLLVAGALTAIQGPSNARLSQGMGSVINGAFFSFIIGTMALGVIALILQVKPEGQAVRSIPWWGWIGGLYGCLFVTSIAWGIPKLGVATTMTLVVAGQLILGVILDHYGALGTPTQPVSLARLGGIALIVGGALLVRRG
ncbi:MULTISPECIES: DMT family transporter [unclassified Brevundimonas]|uniref:DMT family transporter n=1 Tax=unclassified Brevundimonas TaxID=2622653 RepID=UPI0025BDEBE0|nr:MULTISPECIES: DMT family transporter [unclassified Brevundimonas]